MLHSIAQEFAARYCPQDKGVFLTRFWIMFAFAAVVALCVFFAAQRRRNRGLSAARLSIFASVVFLFAIGGAALILYGLAGCTGPAAAGLTWDWP
ncbi:MAG TPA: hypothetical protein VGZ02_07885 [Candidatus Baltobacteraceae bacterium]|jgi:hypothetical protein|nr:hypothetical protein [Candidatus Baltobacteraceae bacterium]